jgi:hypothetical protein
VFGSAATDVYAYVQVSTTADRLGRLLEGSRIRVGSISWRVAAARLTTTSELTVQFDVPASRALNIELPLLFNADTPEHIAWLLYRIEHLLQTHK